VIPAKITENTSLGFTLFLKTNSCTYYCIILVEDFNFSLILGFDWSCTEVAGLNVDGGGDAESPVEMVVLLAVTLRISPLGTPLPISDN